MEGGEYMDHNAGIILMAADGSFAGTLDLHGPKATQLAKMRRLTADTPPEAGT
jgi:protein SCO1